jgi:predicted CoA-binding protein
MSDAEPTPDELKEIYANTKTIAVVGVSSDPSKPGHEIPRYLKGQGFHIIPVSPKGGEMFGEKVRASLSEIDGPVDAVDVFRPPPEGPDIARDAVKLGAKVLWFQQGTDSDEAIEIAQDGGLKVVWGRCMGATHGVLGLGPGPWRGI